MLRPIGFARETAIKPMADRLIGSTDDAFPDRVQNQFRSSVQIQLLENIAAVSLYRVEAQIQQRRHILVILALGQQLQYLALARREQLVTILHSALTHLAHVVFHEHLTDRGTEE